MTRIARSLAGAALIIAFAAAPPVEAQACEGTAVPLTTTSRYTGCPPHLSWTFRIDCLNDCGTKWTSTEPEQAQANGECVGLPLPGEDTHCMPSYHQYNHANGLFATTNAFDTYVLAGCRTSDHLASTHGDCPCAPPCLPPNPKDPLEPPVDHDIQEPILISLGNGNVELTSATAGVRFDLDADGTAEQIAWTVAEGDDAFLVLDRDGNGTIDNGRELFGDVTPQLPSEEPNGFRALAVFDNPLNGGDGDGLLTAADSIWQHLELWLDANHDGISQADELQPLAGSGIDAIGLDYRTAMRNDRHGNLFRYFAPVSHSSGRGSRIAWDVFLTRVD